ncbi:MAG: hypothetical protein H0V82_03775 [Candidatus Protochlamydia sp.]|nr:hypothetical protein [Candidatus Protochlamydia sp.]
MKFAIAKEHRDFFHKKGMIEFEEFLASDQLALFNQCVDEALSNRLGKQQENLKLQLSEALYLEGRDLWRSNKQLHKLVTQPRFAEIASELIEKKPLRLGYTQFFPSNFEVQFDRDYKGIYRHFIQQTIDLQSVSCLENVACGLMICLGKPGQAKLEAGVKENEEEKGIDIFPWQPGQVVYFQPEVPVDWQKLSRHSGFRFFLIVYTETYSHYLLKPEDPHTHFLKHQGYIFNDKLVDRLHPIVYR